jgi:hypothetical protein
MSLLEFLLGSESPLTLETIAESVGKPVSDVEVQLEELLSENAVRKRVFILEDGSSRSVFWPSSLIPFAEQQSPIITSPFSSPFDHQQVLERLSDLQLQQEKSWLQSKLRKINSEFENLQHLAKSKVDPEGEKELDNLAAKWLSASHEMLWNLLGKMKKMNGEMTMPKLLREMRIDPESVKWNEETEDFDE